MSSDNTRVLLTEIERQLDAATLETVTPDCTSPAAKLITGRHHEYEVYRQALLSLHSELLEFVRRAPSRDLRSLQCSSETGVCFWKLPAFCQGHLSSSFILPEPLKNQCMAAVRIRSGGHLRSDETVNIWSDSTLKSWVATKDCCLILAQGSSQYTGRLQRLSCEVVDRFDGKCSTIYMLNTSITREHYRISGPLEILRQISVQALRKIPEAMSIHFLTDMVLRFQNASNDTAWFSILECIMQISHDMCIVVDLSVLGAQSKIAIRWVAEFCNMLSRLGSNCLVKVMLLTNRPLMKDLKDPDQSLILSASSPTQLPRKVASGFDESVEERIVLASVSARRESGKSNIDLDKADQLINDAFMRSAKNTHETSLPPAVLLKDNDIKPHPQTSSGSLANHRREEVEIVIVCALRCEVDAIETLCDEFFNLDQFPIPQGDTSVYSVARIGRHKVVLAYMPAMGKSNAASVVATCRTSFPKIRLAILSGICGGAPFPSQNTEVLLGDVIISDGLVLYDFGRQNPDGFQRKNTLLENARKMPLEISAFMSKLKTRMGQEKLRSRTSRHLETLHRVPNLGQWAAYPDPSSDVLFESTYIHRHHNRAHCEECAVGADRRGFACEKSRQARCAELSCDLSRTVPRKRLDAISKRIADGEVIHPVIHFGVFASGDKVMKSGEDRDEITRLENVIAFEMEGAGIWDQCPCIIVKGVCDYADSHKNKDWQNYAATTAAACVKAMLEEWMVHTNN